MNTTDEPRGIFWRRFVEPHNPSPQETMPMTLDFAHPTTQAAVRRAAGQAANARWSALLDELRDQSCVQATIEAKAARHRSEGWIDLDDAMADIKYKATTAAKELFFDRWVFDDGLRGIDRWRALKEEMEA